MVESAETLFSFLGFSLLRDANFFFSRFQFCLFLPFQILSHSRHLAIVSLWSAGLFHLLDYFQSNWYSGGCVPEFKYCRDSYLWISYHNNFICSIIRKLFVSTLKTNEKSKREVVNLLSPEWEIIFGFLLELKKKNRKNNLLWNQWKIQGSTPLLGSLSGAHFYSWMYHSHKPRTG